MRTKKLHIGYPDTLLFTADDIELVRGDVVALIGPNGSGKSTMLRTIMGDIPQLKGKLRFGDHLKIGYFAQGHEQLELENRVVDEILAVAAMSETDARTFLGQYLFRGEEVFKQVSDLSGGERGRLALAQLALAGANFLLLDEPTNHLDIPSQEVLQTVLERFEGTIVLVSHDRYLVDRLATQIWELRQNHLHLFDGTYQEFLAAREGRDLDGETAVSKVALPTGEKEPEPIDLSWVETVTAPPAPLSKKERRAHARLLAELRDEVEETEAWVTQLQFDLAQAKKEGDEVAITRLHTELAIAEAELASQMTQLDDLID